MILKALNYRGFSPHSGGTVIYTCDGNDCIYTGVTMAPPCTSTINAAEAIIRDILRREAFTARPVFYDLQTHLGYKKQPGFWQVDRVLYRFRRGRLRVCGWQDDSLILDNWFQAFRPLIGNPEHALATRQDIL